MLEDDDWGLIEEAFEFPAEVAGRLQDTPFGEMSPFHKLVLTDCRMRMGIAPYDTLLSIEASLEAERDRELYLPWSEAIRLDYASVRLDDEAFPRAEVALGRTNQDPFADRVLVHSRARLGRVAAMNALLKPHPLPEADELARKSINDFARCGLVNQASVTQAVYQTQRCLVLNSETYQAVGLVEEARDQLSSRRSHEAVLASGCCALLYFFANDFDAAEAEVGRARILLDYNKTPMRDILELVLISPVAAFTGVMKSPDDESAFERLEAAISTVRSAFPMMASPILHAGAELFANFGQLEKARSLFHRGRELKAFWWTDRTNRRCLSARLSILSGESSAVSELKDLIHELAYIGLRDRAISLARKGAGDCELVGDPEGRSLLEGLADEYAMRASESAGSSLPSRFLEQDRSADVPDIPEPEPAVQEGPAAPEVTVRLMAPVVEVTLGSKQVNLIRSTARLLAVLLTCDGVVTDEQLVDRMWPEMVDLNRGKRRLASTLHRLRMSLGLGSSELVSREGPVMRVVIPPRWQADFLTLKYQKDDDAVLGAVLSVSGSVASAQFAYDDALMPARYEATAMWLKRATELLAAGKVTLAELEAPARALEIGPEEIGSHLP